MKRRRQAAGTPDLGPATVAILLAGWVDGHPPPGVSQEPHGFDHEFLTLYDTGGIAKLWRQYEPWLREQARAWGWAPDLHAQRHADVLRRMRGARRAGVTMLKRTIETPPLTPAMVYALMVGEWSTARLPGWVALGMAGELSEGDAWVQHRDALIAEAARYDFKPYWLDERAPSGPGFERWRATFLARHSY